MPSYGATICGTGANSGGGVSWTSPTNIQANDLNYAMVNLAIDGTTKALRATNFGFAVGAGETVTNVKFEISCFDVSGLTNVSSVILVKAGTQAGADQSDSATLPATESFLTYQNANWGTTISPSDCNNSGFGVDFKITGTGNLGVNANVNYIQCTITTTSAAGVKQYIALCGVGTG